LLAKFVLCRTPTKWPGMTSGGSDVNASDIIETLYPKPHITYLFPSENAVATTDAIKALQLTRN
jgi:hypothetical protein